MTQEAFGDKADQTTLLDSIGKASFRLDEIATEMKAAKDEDTARYDALKTELKSQAETLSGLKSKHDGEVRESEVKEAIEMAAEAKAELAKMRTPSKAREIGSAPSVHPASQDGAFINAIWKAGAGSGTLDAERQEALASLKAMSDYQENTKATLGTSDALGGWVIPNAIVDSLVKPAVHVSPILSLVTSVTGVNIASVDMPWRRTGPTAATAITWGSTKTNTDVTYNGYTATMYTLAAIYDVSNQLLRKSMGAAQQDVLQELNGALERGVATYIFQGSGSSQPLGLNAALVTDPPFDPVTTTSHSPASTLAGSVADAIASAAGDLAGRNRKSEAAIMSATGYWTMLAQGSDEGGFYFAGTAQNGSPAGIDAGTLISPFGIPVFYESEYLSGTDDLIIGEFSALKVYFGEGQRIDSSDVAGTRWDVNVTGFRGELEMGFDARPAVYAGALQFVADVLP